jgi:hypothetical protein
MNWRFDEECLHFLGQRKQAKMQWLQDPNRSNLDNLKNVRLELTDIAVTKEGISES